MSIQMKKQHIWDEHAEAALREAVKVMRAGGIILYPTDTVWGIGCDATNADAVQKIYELKQRSDSKSMLVLVGSEGMLEGIVESCPPVAYQLIEAAVRPLTLILDDARHVAPNLIAADGSLGIRVSREAWSAELCRRMHVPVVSTSANISGEPTPHFFDEISDTVKQRVDYIVDYRQNDRTPAEPSEILKLGRDGEIRIIRS